ncbi:MAG: MBOAT family protein [Chitinophagaceae bacterium]|nr:MBOAT family protein [Chitinophagaceae bacterium]
MLFNSFEFLIFFPVVTILFFLLPHKIRWLLLLLASCFFYMFFKPEYILILFFTIIVDYYAGILIERTQNPGARRRFLIMSLIANIGVLAVFKYFNFFNDNITGIASFFGFTNHIPYLRMLLPIGLSFHTFQAMSYTIEVYRGNHKAEKHFGIYALYVMFYPQLVAGPIERPQNILYQFHEKHYFDKQKMVSGLKLMLYGFFKKIVVADRLSIYVDSVYNDPANHHGFQVIVAMIFFAFQIYCDFSGYTDIARGSARVMGFELMPNFNRPYSATSVSEFWKKWHISLSTWFRDYLYIPMGGNRVSRARNCFNLFVTFCISGFWHGAGWTFIIWGLLHGLATSYEFLTKNFRKRLSKSIAPGIYNPISLALTFLFVLFAWVFFRAASIHDAFVILANSTVGLKDTVNAFRLQFYDFLVLAFFLLIEYMWYKKNLLKSFVFKTNVQWRIAAVSYYSLLFWLIVVWGVFEKKSFIYFQF